MSIRVAKTAGFCFGVKRAVEETYKLAENKGKKIVTYGPIIHNEQVINDLKEHGVTVVNSTDEIKKDDFVIIRAHGVGESIYNYFEENNF